MKKIRTVPEGHKVYFTHRRRYDAKTGIFIEPRGGETEARIVKGKDILARGFAICGKRDNFSKRIGRDIALGRALKNLRATD